MAQITGTPSDETLTGTAGDDTFVYAAGGGDDRVNGGTEGAAGDLLALDLRAMAGGSVTVTVTVTVTVSVGAGTGTVHPAEDRADLGVSLSDGGSVIADEVERLRLLLGSGDTTVRLTGDISGTALRTAPIKVIGGAGNDLLDIGELTGGGQLVYDVFSSRTPDTPGAGTSQAPLVPRGAGVAVFASTEANLVAYDRNGAQDIFIRSLDGETIRLLSSSSDGTFANGASVEPVVSDDGNHVGFKSAATNLAPGAINSTAQYYLKDVDSGALTRVSAATDGTAADAGVRDLVLSADGSIAAFRSTADNLVEGDSPGTMDVSVKDLDTGTLTRLGENAEGAGPNADIGRVLLSDDGRYAAFETKATNIVAGEQRRPPGGLHPGPRNRRHPPRRRHAPGFGQLCLRSRAGRPAGQFRGQDLRWHQPETRAGRSGGWGDHADFRRAAADRFRRRASGRPLLHKALLPRKRICIPERSRCRRLGSGYRQGALSWLGP